MQSKAERATAIFNFLKEEGYVPRIDADGDVVFKYEGNSYAVALDEQDPDFVRIIYPNFWPIENDSERRAVEKNALRVTAEAKVAKLFLVGENVWASIELFCRPLDHFFPVFERSIRTLKAAIRVFREGMQKELN